MVGSLFWQKKKDSEKAKHPKLCISFGGSMPIAQIKRCHLTPSPGQRAELVKMRFAIIYPRDTGDGSAVDPPI